MFDSRATRSAALGYGLAFLSILPVAEGVISIEAAGQACGAYFYDMPDTVPPANYISLTITALTPSLVITAAVPSLTITPRVASMTITPTYLE